MGVTSVLLVLMVFSRVNTLTFDLDSGSYRDLVMAFSDRALPPGATLEQKQDLVDKAEVRGRILQM